MRTAGANFVIALYGMSAAWEPTMRNKLFCQVSSERVERRDYFFRRY